MKKMSEDYADDGKFSVLRSRFNNFTEENTSVYRRFQMSRQRYHYRLLLFQLTPFSNLNQIGSKKMAEIPGKKLKEVHTLTMTNENQLDTDTASKLYNYDCPDCYFCLRALTFVPIVYLAIDHFLDCKEHMVVDWVRQMFLMEREAFNAFLGADFNHVYMLPKLAELTFHEFDSQSLYHCSLRMPGDRLANIGNAHFLARQKEAAGDIFDEEESGTELDEEELFAEERVTPEREWKGKIFGRRTLAAGCDNAEETESGNTIASMDTV